jgi:RNA polymerase sigma-70 factor (ECF subfamily)
MRLIVEPKRHEEASVVDENVEAGVVETLVAQHARFLRFLEPRAGSRAAAEELLQAAFVKALERGDELRAHESAVAWFYRLLRNALVDSYRRRDAERRAVEASGHEPVLTPDEEAALTDAVCQCVHALIPTLKPEYAGVLRAVEMDGRSLAEVATRSGITPGNAAVRLHRARQALRRQLELACGTCTEHACLQCACREGQR